MQLSSTPDSAGTQDSAGPRQAGPVGAALAPQAWICRARLADAAPEGLGSLAGLTFAVKDNIDVAGLPTTAACPAFAYAPEASAFVVQRLFHAGACLLGKTNLDQFACGLNGTRSPYGAVPNAFDPAYVSGGSSSGSAYAVATGQVDFSLGTDTAGSGRVPAGLNNIVGLKPTRGLISARGVVPAAQSVDCVSIFAGTVGLAAQGAGRGDGLRPAGPVLAPADAGRSPLPGGVPVWRAVARSTSMAMMRPGPPSTRPRPAWWRWAARPWPSTSRRWREAAALLYESALVAERYAAIRPFFDAHEADVVEPVRSIIARGRDYSAADLYDAQRQLRALGQQAAALWHGMDLLLVPTAPTHYTIAAMQADPVALNRNLGAYTNFVNLLDYAALSVPSSIRPDGLPFGVTLIGPCGSDWQLAELGQRYHHGTGLTQGATGRAAARAAADPRPARRGHGQGGRGRRAPVRHAAEQPACRTRRDAARRRRDRARTTASSRCRARCRPSPACCAWPTAPARASRWRSGKCRPRTTAPSSR